MGKQSLTLVLVAAALTAAALAQEIVIEPTNGRAPTTNRALHPDITRPAAERPIPVEPKNPAPKPAAKSADQERGTAKLRTRKTPANQIAAKPEKAPVETKPSLTAAPEAAMNEAAEPTPAPKKIPARPVWAMADTRDSETLQSEIASALARDPKLAGSAIQVSVDDGTVTLEGRAAGGQQHLQAQRLAKSYAWNRKLVDHISVERSEAPLSMAAKK